MSLFKKFIKDTVIYGMAAVLPKAINVLLVKLHTSFLNTQQYSVNTVFYVWAAYFNVILTYGMETAFFRFYTKEKKNKEVYSSAFIGILLTTTLAYIILLLTAESVASFLNFNDLSYYFILITITYFDTLVVIPYAYLRVLGKARSYAYFRIANIFIYAFFNLLFLWFIPHFNFEISWLNSENRVLGIFVANLIASFFSLLLFFPSLYKITWLFNKRLYLKMLQYGWPVMVAGLAFITNENADKIFIEKTLGPDIMGAYAGAYKICVLMSLFIMAFRLGAEPFFFNQAKEKNAKLTYALIMKWFVIVGCLVVLCIHFHLDLIAQLFLGQQSYFKALRIVPVVLMANLFLGMYHNLSVWYKIEDKTKYGMYFSIGGGIITLSILFWGIPLYGYMAAAWATFICYGLMMLASYIASLYHYKIPYEINKILFYLITTGILIHIPLYYRIWFYLYLICFVFILFFLERKDLTKFFKR